MHLSISLYLPQLHTVLQRGACLSPTEPWKSKWTASSNAEETGLANGQGISLGIGPHRSDSNMRGGDPKVPQFKRKLSSKTFLRAVKRSLFFISTSEQFEECKEATQSHP